MDSMKTRLQHADKKAWRIIILCVAIGLTGVIIIACTALQALMRNQADEYRRLPVVNVIENAQLPSGTYYIYQVYLDADMRYHFLVSDTRGGVVVSAMPGEDVKLPGDILRAEKYDAACYIITVDEEGVWHFRTTNAYRDYNDRIKGLVPMDGNKTE